MRAKMKKLVLLPQRRTIKRIKFGAKLLFAIFLLLWILASAAMAQPIIITSVDPDQIPASPWSHGFITISGNNFGERQGQVFLWFVGNQYAPVPYYMVNYFREGGRIFIPLLSILGWNNQLIRVRSPRYLYPGEYNFAITTANGDRHLFHEPLFRVGSVWQGYTFSMPRYDILEGVDRSTSPPLIYGKMIVKIYQKNDWEDPMIGGYKVSGEWFLTEKRKRKFGKPFSFDRTGVCPNPTPLDIDTAYKMTTWTKGRKEWVYQGRIFEWMPRMPSVGAPSGCKYTGVVFLHFLPFTKEASEQQLKSSGQTFRLLLHVQGGS